MSIARWPSAYQSPTTVDATESSITVSSTSPSGGVSLPTEKPGSGANPQAAHSVANVDPAIGWTSVRAVVPSTVGAAAFST